MCWCCCAGLGEKAVDEGEVVVAFGGLDELPGEGRDDGVERHRRRAWARWLHVVEAGGAGVVKFAAEHKEGLAVDDELCGGAAFFKMRGRCLLGVKGFRAEPQEYQNGWQRREAKSHMDCQSNTISYWKPRLFGDGGVAECA